MWISRHLLTLFNTISSDPKKSSSSLEKVKIFSINNFWFWLTPCKATEDTSELEVTTVGSVDTSKEGIYPIQYLATNSDGFDGAITRYVLVTPDKNTIVNNDLSGTYWRSNNSSREVQVSKVTDGFYQITDAFPTNGVPVTFAQTSASKIVIWEQSSRFGNVVADEFNDPATAGVVIDASTIGWQLRVGSFGVFSITFNKQ